MFRRRKLSVAVAAASAAGVVLGVAAIPSASADQCVVTVTVAVTGQKLNFTVNVPPGTPVSALNLPVTLPILAVTESCQRPPARRHPLTRRRPRARRLRPRPRRPARPRPRPARAPRADTSAPKPAGPGTTQQLLGPPRNLGANRSGKGGKGTKGNGSKSATKPTKTPSLRGRCGPRPLSNPTFSFALPGAAPIGVPNFFIDSFRIPPFLIPIYQAAGIQYDIPWQVLAGINEIETDYGRNLSVSSANAVGWMQFLPSTWKTWGVDANGDGIADPYNPVDAIFAAARYLHAAGGSKNLSQGIFAYNHASWYVQSVLLRAKLIGGMPDQLIGALTGLVAGSLPGRRQGPLRR